VIDRLLNSRYFYVILAGAIALVLVSPYILENLPIYTEGHYHRHAWALGQLSMFDENSSFFWRPRFVFGTPRFSNPLTINYYPLTYLRHFIAEPFFSQILWFASIFIGFIGAQKLFKLKIKSSSLSFTGGLLFSMSGIMMISAFKGQLVEQLPFTVWFFYFYLSGIINNDPRKILISALINSFHLLATETQFLWFYTTTFIPFVGIYFFYIKNESVSFRLKKFIIYNLLFFIPIILITAILVLPVMELQGVYIPPLYNDMSIYRFTGRFNPLELRYSPFVFPGIFKHHLGFGRLRMYINLSYLGAVPLIVCIYYFLNTSHIKKILLLLFTYFLFSAASSFGIGNDLLRLLPPLADMRYSSHWLFAWNLTLCFVFCLGIQNIKDDRELKKILLIGVGSFVSLFVSFSYWYMRQDNLDSYVMPLDNVFTFEMIRPFFFVGIFLIALCMALLEKVRIEVALKFIMVLTVVDIFTWTFHVPRLYSKSLAKNEVFVDCLKNKKSYKKYLLPETPKLGEGRSIRFDIGNNCSFDFLNAGFEMVRSGTTLTLERSIKIAKLLGWHESGFHRNDFEKDFLFDEKKKVLARIFNIKFYFSKNKIEENKLEELGFKLRKNLTEYGLNLYEDTLSLGRVILYSEIDQVKDKNAAFEIVSKGSTLLYEKAVIESEEQIDIEKHARGKILKFEYFPDRVVIKVETTGKMLLFLSDSLYPGWSALVDGVESKIFPTNYMGRGVLLPKGISTVEFKFESKTFKIGLILTLVGLVGTILGIAILSYNRRK